MNLPLPIFPRLTIGYIDIFDIAFVAILLYYFFLLVKGTRAVQILQGVGVLLVLMLLTYILRLETVYWLLHYFILVIAVAIPIVFQPELRRALGFIGRGGILGTASWSRMKKEDISKFAEEIVWATFVLSKNKTGALIVLEKETGLEEFIETGTPVGGEVSSKLLLSIFTVGTPLHDGAVIIRGNKIVAASCYLPLSENVAVSLDKNLGTRHRAALGLTEQTDALVIIVSEETGAVSAASNGKLSGNLNKDTLKKIIVDFCSVPEGPKTPAWLLALKRKGKNGISSKKP